MPIALVTTNPAVKSLKDFTEKDRIALPSVKSSRAETWKDLYFPELYSESGS